MRPDKINIHGFRRCPQAYMKCCSLFPTHFILIFEMVDTFLWWWWYRNFALKWSWWIFLLSINEPWILLSSKSGVKLAIIRSWCDKTPPLCVLCSCFTLSIHGKLQTLIYCQNIYVILLNLHQYLCFDISTNRKITIRTFMFCGVASRVEHCTQPIACNDPLADVGRKIRTPMPAFAINSI